MKLEKGTSLLEVIIAVALLGIISVLFLGGVANSSTARVQADERMSAKILAETLMDNVKKQTYYSSASSYNMTVPAEFSSYAANLTVTNMANGNIQKLNIAIRHLSHDVLTLESYKVKRDD